MPTGVYERKRQTIEERFWPKVDKRSDEECWEWLGTRHGDGYGMFRVGDRTARAHRVSYELHVGPIPEGLTLDHLCRNRACVNPAHLEPATQRENTLRGDSMSARNARKTHCKHGHEFTEENTYLQQGRHGRSDQRRCRICMRATDRRRYSKKRGTVPTEEGSLIYRWGNNSRRAALKGRLCRVIIRGRLNSVLVEFLDNGERVVTSCRALATPSPPDRERQEG